MASKKYIQPNSLLREQRELRGWSLQEVADRLSRLCEAEGKPAGVNLYMVSHWEAGTHRPSPLYRAKLCQLYSLSAAELGLMNAPNATQAQLSSQVPVLERFSSDIAQVSAIDEATFNHIEDLLHNIWHLRRTASLIEIQKLTTRLNMLLRQTYSLLPQPSKLESRLLRLHTQIKLINAVVLIERNRPELAFEVLLDMYQLAKLLADPAMLALALSSIGTELERAGNRKEAINYLEAAKDVAYDASKQLYAFVNAYLARAYAGNGDSLRFQRTIDTAQHIAIHLGQQYGDGTDLVYHRLSGILAERSFGYLALKKPEKTLALKDEITRQIVQENNTWLQTWIILDWTRAYFMQGEIEESVRVALEFLHKALKLQSPHAISSAYEFLAELEHAGYAHDKAVHEFRDELYAAMTPKVEE